MNYSHIVPVNELPICKVSSPTIVILIITQLILHFIVPIFIVYMVPRFNFSEYRMNTQIHMCS